MGKLKGLIWLLPVSGLAIIAMGVVMFFTPLQNLIAAALVFGIFMLASGVMDIVAYFGKEKDNRSGAALGGGLLSILFGGWMLFGRGMVAAAVAMPFIFAAWVMASSVIRIIDAFSRKSEDGKIKIWVAILGALGVIFGFVLLFNPMMTYLIASIMLASMVVIHGVGTIALFFRLRKQDAKSESE